MTKQRTAEDRSTPMRMAIWTTALWVRRYRAVMGAYERHYHCLRGCLPVRALAFTNGRLTR
jgi:hypothetical protein